MTSIATEFRKLPTQTLQTISELDRRKEERTVDHLIALRGILTPMQQDMLFQALMTDICEACGHKTGSKRAFCKTCHTTMNTNRHGGLK